jgi:hypothetical protein
LPYYQSFVDKIIYLRVDGILNIEYVATNRYNGAYILGVYDTTFDLDFVSNGKGN